jgi:hypothetical protein
VDADGHLRHCKMVAWGGCVWQGAHRHCHGSFAGVLDNLEAPCNNPNTLLVFKPLFDLFVI